MKDWKNSGLSATLSVALVVDILSFQQDEDASHDGEDRQYHAQATENRNKSRQAIKN